MPKGFSETAAEAAAEEMCERCEKQPRAPSHKWCAGCKAEAQSRYIKDRDEMCRSQGYEAGIKALRAAILSQFGKANPAGMISVGEASQFIAEVKPPARSSTQPSA